MNEAAAAKVRTPPLKDTPPPDIAVVPMGDAKPSPSQIKAAELRGQLGHIVEVLQTGDNKMRRMGAALFAWHMATELPKEVEAEAKKVNEKWKPTLGMPMGLEAAACMTKDEVMKYAAAFRARFPGCWGAAAQCNIQGFVKFLKIGQLRGLAGDVPAEKMIMQYQTGMSTLSG